MLHSFLLQIVNPAVNAADTAATVTAPVATQLTPVAAPPQEVTVSMLELIMKGGVVMIPIAILLLVTIFILIERSIAIAKASRKDRNFMYTIKDFILNGNFEAALSLCRSSSKPYARLIEKGISRIGKPIKEIEDAIENTGRLELYKLEKNLSILSIIGRIAPMLGFIGTIMGVITIFYDISLSNTISIDVIAGGLYQKMVTSASGLVVGVLAFLGYHWLNIYVDKIVHHMETSTVEFIDLLHQPAK